MPALLNTKDVQRALERAYPVFLKEAGIGGRAHLWLFIDESGQVVRAELKQSSGQRALDEVALSVAPMMRFSPAMNRDQRVKVMVHVPLDFKAQ
jgi:TonB family protein